MATHVSGYSFSSGRNSFLETKAYNSLARMTRAGVCGVGGKLSKRRTLARSVQVGSVRRGLQNPTHMVRELLSCACMSKAPG